MQTRNEELENRTELISLQRVEELTEKEYVYTKPFTGFSFRLDSVNGGIFVWSKQMNSYFLIAKKR